MKNTSDGNLEVELIYNISKVKVMPYQNVNVVAVLERQHLREYNEECLCGIYT